MAFIEETLYVIINSLQTSPVQHRRASLYALPPTVATATAETSSVSPDRFSSRAADVRAVVLDDFTNAERAGVTTHGELVETELLRNQPGLSVTRQQVALNGGMDAINRGQRGSLDNFFRNQFTERLDNASDGWAGLLDTDGPRAVVHQSQGASQSRAVEPLWGRVQGDTAFRQQVERQLGLPSSGDSLSREERSRLLGALVTRSDQIHRQDPAVRGAVDELRLLQEEASDRGHIHVISAGNQGALEREMNDLGVAIPSGFFRNEFVGPESIVVGAADDGTRDARSGRPAGVASIASPNAGAHIAADAVDRPMMVEGQLQHHTGSSYAAPQVSSMVLDMLRAEPDLSRQEILTRLRSQASPLPGQERYVGAGVVSYNR